jgi:hypothetical protein
MPGALGQPFCNDHVGDAEGLAGHNQQVSALYGHVGDRGIADDDLGGGPRQLHELRLVIIDNQVLDGLRLIWQDSAIASIRAPAEAGSSSKRASDLRKAKLSMTAES